MSKPLKERLPSFDQAVQYLIAAGVVVFISLLFPNTVQFKYEFNFGDTWRYDDLVAPFDFAIKKSKDELAADRERILQNASPHYRLYRDLSSAKIQDAEAELERWINSEKILFDSLGITLNIDKAKAEGGQMLTEIYAQHIIDTLSKEAQSAKGKVITVVEGITAYKRTSSSFYMAESARKELLEKIKKSSSVWPAEMRQILLTALVPDLIFDAELSEKIKQEKLAGMVSTKGMVEQGEPIVNQGELVTKDVYQKLLSLEETYASEVGSKRSARTVYLGYLLITALIMTAFVLYLNAHRKDVLLNWKFFAFLLSWLVIFSGLTFILEKSNAVNAYIVPFCIVPILVSHFFTFRLAFFTHIVVVLIAGLLTRLGFEFIFIQIIAGVIAMLTVADERDWGRFFRSVLMIILAYSLSHFAISIIEEGNLISLDWEVFGLLGLNGLLTLLAFPLIPLVERIFGFTSSISLLELSDMNKPLLRELAINAPGTLQHSLQVGNLCEAAANEIGADALLVKVAALYHDIGKMKRPEYFVENQGANNPHKNMEPMSSAQIIIDHVLDGIEMAKKANLPKVLIRFIETHHGDSRVHYFYKKQLQQNPGEDVDEKKFTYPGPKPATKEEAIMMVADTIEAASRSLKSPTREDIDELVEKLTEMKVKNGQLDDSDLTLGELARIKKVFKKMLRSIHHVRIEYPD